MQTTIYSEISHDSPPPPPHPHNIDGDHGYVQPDRCLRSECHAATEGVLHEPGQEPSQAGQQKDTETHLNYHTLHRQLVCH